MIGAEDLTRAFVASVNAGDPDVVGSVALPETGDLESLVAMVSERWPRVMMTRGDLRGRPVGVFWMPDRNDRYRQVAHIELVPDVERVGVSIVEDVDPDLVAEAPARLTVAEWECAEKLDRDEGGWT